MVGYSPRGHKESDTTEQLHFNDELGLHGGSVVKNPLANIGDEDLTCRLRRSPGERNVKPLQYSWLRNLQDRGAGVLQSVESQKIWT